MDSNQKEDDHPSRRNSVPGTGNFYPQDQYPTTDLETGNSSQAAADNHGSATAKKSIFGISNWRRSRPRTKSKPSLSDTEKAVVGKNLETQYQEIPSHNESSDSTKLPQYTEEAKQLVRSFTQAGLDAMHADPRSGAETPYIDKHLSDVDYVPPPSHYRPSVFGAILSSRLNHIIQETSAHRGRGPAHGHHHEPGVNARGNKSSHQRSRSHDSSPLISGTTTPTKKIKWYEERQQHSLASALMQAGMSTTSLGLPATSNVVSRPTSLRFQSTDDLLPPTEGQSPSNYRHSASSAYVDLQGAVVAEVAEIIACRKYLTKLCGALMRYGAPTHRLEEYLRASARALLIDADFLYIPGAMVCTFYDHTIQANNVEVVRGVSGLDFGRLRDVFDVYKCVIHHKLTAEQGILQVDNIQKRPDRHSQYFRILMFGFASLAVGPFSFNTRIIDLPPIFILGCALGFLQIKVVPKSEQFSNVFEVFACVMIAFISRALGSIKGSDGAYIFCFSGVAQSSIAMILPGFLVLNSALELQSRNIVAGSVRMVYAIIYVLFLGFGLLVGTTVFGLIKRDAVDDVTCRVPEWFSPDGVNYKLLYTRFIWAPLFACGVALVYQAKWKQLPVMALIAVAGHQANFWISTQLSSNLQVANAIGAFVIGCLANLYSRVFHGLAAAAMLPAIYCQVPGGLAASGTLVAGVDSSNQIIGNSTAITIINNGTQGFIAAQDDPNSVYGGTIFNVGYGMVQVAIGISVGLYLSALVVYPYGKRRSGLFSF
ncbi:hypothetical protein, variant [Exophiala mesophila]|uniref:Threonine/serine exporter-like N-terminal domain-containing protein n=1 Tax=Exophiala mesophila TaxID=212818 RepID=A0A0D1Z8X4_EXOME|nr:uncharacterized protein PV10_05743 [Exophiala mesophila]XP_016222751.1 hypothetical protein, variant [Exophiala mesophila]KIV91176.1 hypothetical protein PV10_05743 [Exophiala mesophila]KIV91177.1 hypothetical protein, variant [Exophiala mesophila]